jgi:hypothetical protein
MRLSVRRRILGPMRVRLSKQTRNLALRRVKKSIDIASEICIDVADFERRIG